jgi:hypothetical protein
MSESYDETNKRMSQALGPRSGIQTSADVAEAEAVQQAKRELESQANPALAGSHVDGWDGITFRCEPPDRFQFVYDKASNAIIIRDMQQETASEESVAGGISFVHPFKVALVTPATPTAAITASSRLYKSISTTDTQTITDLTTAFTLASNTHVWIQVTVSALAVTAASRQTGTAWPTLIVTSGTPAAQTQFNIPVGRVVASAPTKPGFEFSISGTAYHFEQCLFSHLLTESRCNNGTPVLFAFPWSGAA